MVLFGKGVDMVEFLQMSAAEFRRMVSGEQKYVRDRSQKRSNKYGAVKTTIGDTTYDSKKEAYRGAFLEQKQKEGKISHLEKQKEFVLIDAFECRGVRYRKCSWIADFYYYDEVSKHWVAEDVKSFITRKKAEYRIKVKLFIKRYPKIWFEEIV